MRIALLVRRWSIRGGSGKNAVELARHLVARGHDIRVFAQKDDGSAGSSEDGSLGDRLTLLGGAWPSPTLSMLSFARRAERVVLDLRRPRSVDVVIGFDHSTLQDVFRLGGGIHAEFMEATRGARPRPGGVLLDAIALALEKKRLQPHRSRLLVAVSRRCKADVERHYGVDPSRVVLVRNAVDSSRYTPDGPEGERARVRARWGVSADEKVALLVGQNPMLKGLDVAQTAAERAGLRLVYVGGTGRARRWVHRRVVWDGPRLDVVACYRAADVLIQPSRYENFGNVILEAAACGLPTVAPDWIGATELFEGTEAAELLVRDASDADALAERMVLATDPRRAPAFRQAALGAARSEAASPERWMREMEAVLVRGSSMGS